MLYYIFKVRTNKPNLVPDYYILNNQYIGYIGTLDPINRVESILERNAGVNERQYQPFAKGLVAKDEELHELNCASKRLTLEEANALAKKYKLTKSRDKTWYEVYFPDKHSSDSYLREIKPPEKTPKLKTIK